MLVKAIFNQWNQFQSAIFSLFIFLKRQFVFFWHQKKIERKEKIFLFSFWLLTLNRRIILSEGLKIMKTWKYGNMQIESCYRLRKKKKKKKQYPPAPAVSKEDKTAAAAALVAFTLVALWFTVRQVWFSQRGIWRRINGIMISCVTLCMCARL